MLLLLTLKPKQVKIFTLLNVYSLKLTIDAGSYFLDIIIYLFRLIILELKTNLYAVHIK